MADQLSKLVEAGLQANISQAEREYLLQNGKSLPGVYSAPSRFRYWKGLTASAIVLTVLLAAAVMYNRPEYIGLEDTPQALTMGKTLEGNGPASADAGSAKPAPLEDAGATIGGALPAKDEPLSVFEAATGAGETPGTQEAEAGETPDTLSDAGTAASVDADLQQLKDDADNANEEAAAAVREAEVVVLQEQATVGGEAINGAELPVSDGGDAAEETEAVAAEETEAVAAEETEAVAAEETEAVAAEETEAVAAEETEAVAAEETEAVAAEIELSAAAEAEAATKEADPAAAEAQQIAAEVEQNAGQVGDSVADDEVTDPDEAAVEAVEAANEAAATDVQAAATAQPQVRRLSEVAEAGQVAKPYNGDTEEGSKEAEDIAGAAEEAIEVAFNDVKGAEEATVEFGASSGAAAEEASDAEAALAEAEELAAEAAGAASQ